MIFPTICFLSQTLDFKNLATACHRRRQVRCDNTAGRNQVLLTVDRRPTPVDDTQRPALCRPTYFTWEIRRELARRAGQSTSIETLITAHL